MPSYSIETYGELNPYVSFEWLLTNGLGGFASSTVVACNTRRYHGLLIAATTPPVGRITALSRLGEILTFDDRPGEDFKFSINQFRLGIFPRGDRYLRRFSLNDDVARFEYEIEAVRIVKEVQAIWHRNVVGIRYTLEGAEGRRFRLQLLPFTGLRDFHALRSAANTDFTVTPGPRQVCVQEGNNSVYVQSDAGQFEQRGDWWYAHTYAVDAERGQEDAEDLFCPGAFVFETAGKGTITLWAGVEPTGLLDWNQELARRSEGRRHVGTALADANPAASKTIPSAKADPTKSLARLTLSSSAASSLMARPVARSLRDTHGSPIGGATR